jgi:nucleotide-binding universal stress UspA family protein
MATTTLQQIRAYDAPDSQAPPQTGPVLVATDGTPRSDAALRAAHAIVALTGQTVLVLAVHAPLPVLGPEVSIPTSPSIENEARSRLHDQVIEQLQRLGIRETWPLKVSTGSPGALIAKLAERMDASLIVMGLGGHDVFDRIFGDEMALQVLRVGTVPVLAVADEFTDLPERVLVGMDFSSSAKRAFELGAPLTRAGGRLTIANVLASERGASSELAPDVTARMLERLLAMPNVSPGVVRAHSVTRGDPAKELLRLAREMHVDLIVTGSHGHNFLSRLLVGSVSTKLLRQAGCSILVAPPMDVPDVYDELPLDRQRFTFYEWTERLEEFTRRNMWRRAKLEVIDRELGAQVVQEQVPFMGASFDPRDGRVHIMFGGRENGSHATHSIDGVTAIQTLNGRTRGNEYLRIGYGEGQTLLTLER